MDLINSKKKKRSRDQDQLEGAITTPKKDKRSCEASSTSTDVADDALRPPGLFEFPWHKDEEQYSLIDPASSEAEDWDIRRVFFSSLVDGCSADVGFPGDRFSSTVQRSLRLLEEMSDGDHHQPPDGAMDCVWSFILRQPLVAKR
ncbi:hypothetical protein Cni_G15129 [Canna indica]|uniref:Uncharacterized protein n=1 Tax=Canna indica TaxID=4628 RepID=A0AAQ3KFH9_9LILI|nr:hypothetical protein Cni_G15129 [Canna indica]